MSQQFHVVTLEDMIGHIRSVKPTCSYGLARDFVNQAIRKVIDKKMAWAGTVKRGFLDIPASYSTGTVSMTTGSDVVTGSGTSWPDTDKVNTTIPAISERGLQWVQPASMTGIDVDTVLYVNSGASAETVRVIETRPTSFRADFEKTHATSTPIKCSSLAGRQFASGDTSGSGYTIEAVVSATSLLVEIPWAGAAVSGASYEIVKRYFSIDPLMKHIISAVDPVQPRSLILNVQQAALDISDPKRLQAGPPVMLANMAPSPAGNMQYELYPTQREARKLVLLYSTQWPELRGGGQLPPSFINPNVFIWDALSRALRVRQDASDIYYNEVTANWYGAQADKALDDAAQADEAKLQQQLEYFRSMVTPMGGANWAREHAAFSGDSGGVWW